MIKGMKITSMYILTCSHFYFRYIIIDNLSLNTDLLSPLCFVFYFFLYLRYSIKWCVFETAAKDRKSPKDINKKEEKTFRKISAQYRFYFK